MTHLLVAGLGPTGLLLAVRAAEVGLAVTATDPEPGLLARLRAADSPDPAVPDARLLAALDTDRLRLSRGCAGFDVCVITEAAPAGLRRERRERAASAVAPLITPGATVIVETSVPAGAGGGPVRPLLEAGSGLRAGAGFRLAHGTPDGPDGPRRDAWAVSGVDAASLEAAGAFLRLLGASVRHPAPPDAREWAGVRLTSATQITEGVATVRGK